MKMMMKKKKNTMMKGMKKFKDKDPVKIIIEIRKVSLVN
jgi:hypothetical protein